MLSNELIQSVKMSCNKLDQMGVGDTLNDTGGGKLDYSSNMAVELNSVNDHLISVPVNNENVSLLKSIECLFDAKFNKLEQRLNEMMEKNEKFNREVITEVISSKPNVEFTFTPTDIKCNNESTDGTIQECINNVISMPNNFMMSVDEKLKQISQSLDSLEKRRDEDSVKILDICNKTNSLETKFQELDNFNCIVPKIESLQENLTTMLNGESEANDVIDKLIPTVTKMEADIAMIGKDVAKIDKNQEMDYRKLKDDVLYNMKRAIDDTYGKVSDTKAINMELMELVGHRTDDLKRNGRDVMENTEDLLDKVSKIDKSVEELRHTRRRTESQSKCGPTERSGSPPEDKERSKQPTPQNITDNLNNNEVIRNKLVNIEMMLADAMKEIRKDNVTHLIEGCVIPKLCSVQNELESHIRDDIPKRVEDGNNKQWIINRKENISEESRIKDNKNISTKQGKQKTSINHIGPTEEIGTFLDQFGSMQPFTKWTYDDITSLNIKTKERKRNSSSSSLSSSSDGEKSAKPVRKLSNNKNNVVTTLNNLACRSRSKTKSKSTSKKRFRPSSESTSSSDDSTSTLAEHLTNAAMARQVSKISIAVEGIQNKIDQWMKNSKLTPKKCDENPTSDILLLLNGLNDKMENNISIQRDNQVSQNAMVEKERKEFSFINNAVDQMMVKLQEIESANNQQCKQIEGLNVILKDTNDVNESKVDEVLQRMKAIQPNNPLMNENILGKLDEVLQKAKSTQKTTNQYKETSLSMMTVLMEVKKQVTEMPRLVKGSESTKGRTDENLLSAVNKIQPKMDDWYTKMLAILEEIRKVQRQTAERQTLEGQETNCHIERILDIVKDIKETNCKKDAKPNAHEQQSSLMNNNTALQVFNVLNELRENVNNRDQTMGKVLNEIKMNVETFFPRFNDSLKTKTIEKSLTKMCSAVEEIKVNQVADMKTFSGINTMLQGIKASDNKIAAQIKDMKGIFKDFGSLGGEDHSKLTKSFKDLEIKHDLSLENMKVFQKDGFDEMKGLLHLVSKAIEKISKDGETLPRKDQKLSSELLPSIQKLFNQIQSNCDTFGSDLRKGFQDQSKLIKGLSNKLHEKDKNVSNNTTCTKCLGKGKITGTDQFMAYKEDLNKLEKALSATYVENSNKILKEIEKINDDNGAHSEILNSVEDLKQLTSSTPHAVHDLVPQIEKMAADIAKIPDDIGGYTAGLEENLCANLEGRIKDVHMQSLAIIEQRLAVIKKYVKYGNNTSNFERNDTGIPDQDNGASNKFTNDDSHYPSTISPTNHAEMVGPITQECKGMIEESFNNFKDDLKQIIDNNIGTTLNTLYTVEQQILNEQAKAVVIEEQFEALVNTLMQPIIDLKSYQSDVTNNFVNVSIKEMEERLSSKQNEGVALLKDIRTISDIATNYGPALAENQHAIGLVSRLVKHLIHVQKMQEELLKQGDKSIECQTATNQVFETLVPTLEEIQNFLEKGENQIVDFGEIPELTKQLLGKINSLNELESKFLASPRLSNCEDLSELIITCLTVLDNLVTSVTDEPVSSSTKDRTTKGLGHDNSAINTEGNKKRKNLGKSTVIKTKSTLPPSGTIPVVKTQFSSKAAKLRNSVLTTKTGVSTSTSNNVKCKAKLRQSRGNRTVKVPNVVMNQKHQSADQQNLQKELGTNPKSTSRTKNTKRPSSSSARKRQTSSSADDSGCSDTTTRSTRDSGLSLSLKSLSGQEPDCISADFENVKNENDNQSNVKGLNGASNASNLWGPKRQRTNSVDLEESRERDDIGNSKELFDEGSIIHDVNERQNVSEDEAKRPEWQPKVIVSKDLTNTNFEVRGGAKISQSPLSVCSSPSSFSISSLQSSDEKETMKIKY